MMVMVRSANVLLNEKEDTYMGIHIYLLLLLYKKIIDIEEGNM